MAGDTVITIIGNLTADPEMRFTQTLLVHPIGFLVNALHDYVIDMAYSSQPRILYSGPLVKDQKGGKKSLG